VDAGALISHVVLLPSASPHRTRRLVADVDLLLAATIANVRMNRPAIVVRPAGVLGRLQAVPGGLRGGQEDRRAGGRHHKVDGVDLPAKWGSALAEERWGMKTLAVIAVALALAGCAAPSTQQSVERLEPRPAKCTRIGTSVSCQ
jgi:hypothetical protein